MSAPVLLDCLRAALVEILENDPEAERILALAEPFVARALRDAETAVERIAEGVRQSAEDAAIVRGEIVKLTAQVEHESTFRLVLADLVESHRWRRRYYTQAEMVAFRERALAAGEAFLAGDVTHRHVKRGSSYIAAGRVGLQCAVPQKDGARLVVYVGEDGHSWARPVAEFFDGRFEAIEKDKP